MAKYKSTTIINVQFPTQTHENIIRALGARMIETGKHITVSEYVREAVEEKLHRDNK